MGITFKENVSDLRNSQALEVVKILLDKKFNLDIYDPLIKKEKIEFKNKNIYLKKNIAKKKNL